MLRSLGWCKIVLAAALAAPAVALRATGTGLPPLASVAAYGGAVVAAAFLMCWAAEAVQLDLSASLATAILALIAVLPEYAVDLYFAYASGRQPELARYAAANMTGSNRLLLGLGWPLALACLWLQGRRTGVPVRSAVLEPCRRVELAFLGLAGLAGLVFPLLGRIPVAGGLALTGLYLAYAWRLAQEARREPTLVGVAARLGALAAPARRLAVALMFLWAALVVGLAAKPFAHALVDGGRALGLDQFLLVQWIAPLATEAPEFLVAVLLALRGAADTALGTLLSSKVNQWTLLVGGLPLAHALGGGGAALPLDPRQAAEFWLTAAQTLLGFALLVKLELRGREAAVLLLLFAAQFPVPAPGVRLGLALFTGLLAAALLWRQRRALPPLVRGLARPGAEPGPVAAGPWPGSRPVTRTWPQGRRPGGG